MATIQSCMCNHTQADTELPALYWDHHTFAFINEQVIIIHRQFTISHMSTLFIRNFRYVWPDKFLRRQWLNPNFCHRIVNWRGTTDMTCRNNCYSPETELGESFFVNSTPS